MTDPVTINPLVIDISHHNNVQDLSKAAAFGIKGIIHKSSEGASVPDRTYGIRRAAAAAAGLLWGAYHFNTSAQVDDQVKNFFANAQPDDNTLMCLDFEDNAGNNMSLDQAYAFVNEVDQKTGRSTVVYSGNRLKETILGAHSKYLEFFVNHRLWLCQYGPKAVLPPGFKNYWLWQYTGDGVGAYKPINVPGIVAGNKGLDINHYPGTPEQLAQEWAGKLPVVQES